MVNNLKCVEDFYYDPTSPTCIRWAKDVRSGKNGSIVKYKVGDVAGYLDSSRGYCRVRSAGELVHRIVYELHFGPIPDGYVVNHKDRNRQNNKIENLELTTQRLNCHNSGMKQSNTSGVNGVYKIEDRIGAWYWVASWNNIDGSRRSKWYSINKYGDDAAFELAKTRREAAIRELNRNGANYTDLHGK